MKVGNKIGIFLFCCLGLTLNPAAYAATELSGYFDTEYTIPDVGKGGPGTFDVHHLSVILQHEASVFKFFAETEFEHVASIEDNEDGSGANGRGKIYVERAWAEWNYSNYVNIRTGQIQTPTLWQSNHYPNLIPSVTRPQMVRNIFKKDFLGAKMYGDLPAGLNYKVWTMRGDEATTTSSVTGHTTAGVRRGGFSYAGRIGYKQDLSSETAIDIGLVAAHYSDPTTLNPRGIEINLQWSDLTLWTEFAIDRAINGVYALVSYEFEIGKESSIAPFIIFDHLKEASRNSPSDRIIGGINYKPLISIAAKVEGVRAFASNGNKATTDINLQFVYFFN